MVDISFLNERDISLLISHFRPFLTELTEPCTQSKHCILRRKPPTAWQHKCSYLKFKWKSTTVKSFDCVLWAAFRSLKPPYRLREAALFITPDRMIMWGRLNTDSCFSQTLTCCRAENVNLFLRGVKALESVGRKGCIPPGSRLYCFLDYEICWVQSWNFTGGLWAPSTQGAAALCALFCWSPPASAPLWCRQTGSIQIMKFSNAGLNAA